MFPTRADAWWTPDDPAVDVAVCELAFDAALDLMLFDGDLIATPDLLAEHEIGIGDELSVVGLFSSVVGRLRNRPIVWGGTIAAMPDERLVDPEVPPEVSSYAAYLVELRSTGGLSGSPVFVMLGPDRDEAGARLKAAPSYLLGLIRGHWYAPLGGDDVFYGDGSTVNRGIAIVTPIKEVAKLLIQRRVSLDREATHTATRALCE